MTKDTALEVREENGAVKLFLLTGLVDVFDVTGLNGIPIINPLDALHLTADIEYPNTERFFWVDRNDFIIQWQNAEGKRGAAFSDVAIQIGLDDGEPDAWLVAEYIKAKTSKITNSKIGSSHWFNTIISEHSRVGEFMRDIREPFSLPQYMEYSKEWGKRLHDSSKELLHWAEKSKTKQLTND